MSDKRNTNVASNTVGNDENSNGDFEKRVTVKISAARENDAAKPMSKSQDGMGNIIITITTINATVNTIVGICSFVFTAAQPSRLYLQFLFVQLDFGL